MPDGGRTGLERREIFEIERRKKAVGVHPDADAFDKNVAVHRHGWTQVCAEDTVVFGIHAAKVNAQPRHAAEAVGQQNKVRGLGLWARGGRFGRQKTNCRRNFLRGGGVAFQNQSGFTCVLVWGKAGDESAADRN